MNSEKLCGDPDHRFTLCEINSIKTDNINGSIKKNIGAPQTFNLIYTEILEKMKSSALLFQRYNSRDVKTFTFPCYSKTTGKNLNFNNDLLNILM